MCPLVLIVSVSVVVEAGVVHGGRAGDCVTVEIVKVGCCGVWE